jgi:hypothetical protein
MQISRVAAGGIPALPTRSARRPVCGAASHGVRQALLFYALKRLGLDVAPGARPPHEQHIVLVNREEVEAMRIRRADA